MTNKYNFSDPDFFMAAERKSYDGVIDTSHFPPAEYKYFSELKKIYYAFKFEGLPKEEASRRKSLIYRSYQDAVCERNRCSEVYKRYQDNIRIAEMNLSKIHKTSDIREIALLACEVIGCLTGDETFYRLQKRKILNDEEDKS